MSAPELKQTINDGEVRYYVEGQWPMESLPKKLLIQTIFDLRKQIDKDRAIIRLQQDSIITYRARLRGQQRSKDPEKMEKREEFLADAVSRLVDPNPKGRHEW
jgi:hypothetical protein